MLLIASAATACGYVIVGAVLYRAAALSLLRLDKGSLDASLPTDRDLLLRSALPALAITGCLETYLAFVHLFRADVTVIIGILVLIWRRHDTLALTQAALALLADCWRRLLRRDIWPALALAAFCALGAALLSVSRIPSQVVDVWVFQLPLAKSMVAHHGFIYPQMDHLFYANNPLFFNVLFAEGLLFVDHFVAANAMNIAIFLGFLVALASFGPRARALGFLLVVYLIAPSTYFSPGATMPMTDVPRSCYSVLALLYACEYLHTRRSLELITAGLLVGAAVAGKYTELISIGLIGLCLLPSLLRERAAWFRGLGFGAAVLAVAGFWYIKNWVLYGNPIYPFVFGHPGLSDAWMADYMKDITTPFNPADRQYVTNLLTLKGWHDFLYILYNWFIEPRLATKVALAVIIVGLAIPKIRIRVPTALTLVLSVIWYTMMFNSTRWATPAYLLFFSTAYLATARLFDLLMQLLTANRDAIAREILKSRQWMAGQLEHARQRTTVFLVLGGCAALVMVGFAAKKVWNGMTTFSVAGMDNDVFNVAVGLMNVDEYMSSRREGYALYRYIADHDLHTVFQPFDNGAIDYVDAYNGGRHGDWILNWRVLPANGESTEQFIAENNIHYFVDRTTMRDVEIDRLGTPHVDQSKKIVAQLLPRSQRLLTDSFGWSLYEIKEPR